MAIARPRRAVRLIQCQPQPEFVETLLTVRRIFEPAVAALAARVASNDALQGIADAYAGMEAARTADELLEPETRENPSLILESGLGPGARVHSSGLPFVTGATWWRTEGRTGTNR